MLKVIVMLTKAEASVMLPLLNLEISPAKEVSIPITVKEWTAAEENGTLDALLVERKYSVRFEAKNRKTCSWIR